MGHRNIDRLARVTWLLAHQDQWEGMASAADPRRETIIKAMQAAGLFSVNTRWQDVRLMNFINAARKQRRSAA